MKVHGISTTHGKNARIEVKMTWKGERIGSSPTRKINVKVFQHRMARVVVSLCSMPATRHVIPYVLKLVLLEADLKGIRRNML